MWDPCIPEVTEMFERMNNVHKRELYRSRIIWKTYSNPDGTLVQVVPVVDMLYKF